MTNNNYIRGMFFELRVLKYYKRQGFFAVRSSGSFGPADVVAIKKGDIRLIQCKLNGRIPSNEVKALKAACKRAGAEGYLAHREGRKLIIKKLI